MRWGGHRRKNICIKKFGFQISGVEITLPKGIGKENMEMHLREQYTRLTGRCIQHFYCTKIAKL